jgi:3'-phosphoadenosine 5'-phosphosulfate (PAPS) 3'-phosphatase
VTERQTEIYRTEPTFDRELRVAVELAREAGAAILEHYEGPLHIEEKNYYDDLEPVTQADKLANELIVSRLSAEFPNDGILAEESIDTAHRLNKSRVWMVDPLDGTNGFNASSELFINRSREFCIVHGLGRGPGLSVRTMSQSESQYRHKTRFLRCV